MNKSLKTYLFLVNILSVICIIFSILTNDMFSNYFYQTANYYHILALLLLSFLSDSLVIKYRDTTISVSFALTIVSLLSYGILTTILIRGISVTLRIVKFQGKYFHILNMPYYKTLYNISSTIISIFFSGFVYFGLMRFLPDLSPVSTFLRFIIFVLIFILSNMSQASILVSLIHSTSFKDNFFKYIKVSILDIVFISPFGLILHALILKFDLIGLLIFIIPILLLRYILKLYLEE